MEAKDLIVTQYLPFSMETIISRSITYIDGLKPVQRRVLYSMYELGLLKDTNATRKSAKIVGDCMGKYHPHGDASIYQAACAMADKYEGNNAAFIAGRGNLGKKYSNPKLGGIHAAAMRYSEMGFTPLAKELFGGINDDAVDFVPNFDDTEKEPIMLPVAFPSVIINMNKGVAVGESSCQPSYELSNACEAVAGYIDGTCDTDEKMIKALGVPDFQSECTVHSDDALLMKLYKTGRASLRCTATFHVQGNEIIIDSVPPTTTFEAVLKQIIDYATTPDGGKEILDAISNTGNKTKGIRIKVKNNTNVSDLMKRLYAKTKLMDTISFYSQIIWKGAPEQCSIKKLIDHWVSFRESTLKRIYINQQGQKAQQEHKLATWEKIKNDIKVVVQIIVNNTEEETKKQLSEKYGLDDIQSTYLLDMAIRNICTDKAEDSIKKLDKLRDELNELNALVSDKELRKKVIVGELRRIAKAYAVPRKSGIAGLVDTSTLIKKREIPTSYSTVYITSRGFIKAVDGVQGYDDANRFLAEGDEIAFGPLPAKKNELLLVYTYSGVCYKLLIDDIESSKGSFKQRLWELVDRVDASEVFYVTHSGDWAEQFAVIYGTGRGRMVAIKDVSGNRKVYKNQFLPGVAELGSPDTMMLIPYKYFVIATLRGKAAMGSLEYMQQHKLTGAFKVTGISSDDGLYKVLNASNFDAYVKKGYLDYSKYTKGYPIKYGNDPISFLDKPVEEYEKAWAEFQEQQRIEEEQRKAELPEKARAIKVSQTK